jgi:tellurite resistance-related uncharacterized protein
MKPFNLEEAKAGKPLVTRDGRKARFIAHVPECKPDWRVLACIDGEETATAYTETGLLFENSENSCDLFMATEKREGWVNVYPKSDHKEYPVSTFCSVYESKGHADEAAGSARVACIRIEWEE